MAGARLILRAMSYARKTRPRIVARVIREAGGVTALARAMTARGHRIGKMAVSLWRAIPRKRARVVAKITGIPVAELRPDLYGKS